jgi:hypothetical protein
VLAGCAGISGRSTPAPLDPPVEALISQLSRRNSDLKTFKASGRVAIHHKSQFKFNQTGLWAGLGRAKMRLTLLGIDGRPITSMVRDGKRLDLLFHPQDRLETLQIGESGLQRVTQIEFSPDTLAALLLGQIPMENYRTAEIVSAAGRGALLALKGRWGKTLQRIYFTPDTRQVQRIETYNARGNLRYQADLGPPRTHDGFQIPSRIDIRNDQDDRLSIEIQRYWPNAPLPEGIFSIEPATQGRAGPG